MSAVILETTVPEYGGEERIAELGGNVTVIRDANAVPHIFAEDPLDAYRALGFVHAQDRFFQMELMRRIGTGRLSEIVGSAGLRTDRFMRTLDVANLAKAAAANMDPETRAAADAYSEGVNAWLQSPNTKRPPELIFLGITPEPWRAADSAMWGRLMSLLLSNNWTTELLRARMSLTLEPEQIADLWPGEPNGSATTLSALPKGSSTFDFAAIEKAIPKFLISSSASNQWVVDGSRSATGKPLLANDPHLGFMAPGMWHLARIETPTYQASGATLPGQPFFIIGHNNHLAWGFTTTHADTQDLFIERTHPENTNQYLTPQGSRPFETREETINVRFRSNPEKLLVRSSRHGPIISDISAAAASATLPGDVIALAFPGLREDDKTADAFFKINRATTREELFAGLRQFHSPMQNIVYAFTNGDIGFAALARLPMRITGDGRMPVPGWTGEHDWLGFVPFEELPQSNDPQSGWIANANNRVVDERYPHLIAADWPESFRAERVSVLLEEKRQHDIDGFASMQLDIVSPLARDWLPVLLQMLDADTQKTESEIIGKIRNWNGVMAREQPEPLVFVAWLAALGPSLYADELGQLSRSYRGIRPRVLRHLVENRPVWCDDTNTPAVEDCNSVVSAAFVDALSDLRERLGNDVSEWKWGTLHKARFEHPILRRIPLLRELFDVTIATDGSDFTINRGTPQPTADSPFTHVHGAGLRALFDLSNLANSRLMIATGQSGHVRSPFFDDTTPLWRDGRYLRLNGTREQLRGRMIAELSLTP